MQDESLGPISRWLRVFFPLSVTAALVVFALRMSSGESTPVLGRYTVRYSLFLSGILLADVAAIWGAMSLERWGRALVTIRTVPFFRLSLMLGIGLFLSDLFVSLHYTLIGVPYLVAVGCARRAGEQDVSADPEPCRFFRSLWRPWQLSLFAC